MVSDALSVNPYITSVSNVTVEFEGTTISCPAENRLCRLCHRCRCGGKDSDHQRLYPDHWRHNNTIISMTAAEEIVVDDPIESAIMEGLSYD